MSKGSGVRPHDKKKFDEEYERVFGVKELNVWTDALPKEEKPDEKERTGTDSFVPGQDRPSSA